MVNKELTVLVAGGIEGFIDCVLFGTADHHRCRLYRGAAEATGGLFVANYIFTVLVSVSH
jgi:hypothetical protein